jgi:hypothetical protein
MVRAGTGLLLQSEVSPYWIQSVVFVPILLLWMLLWLVDWQIFRGQKARIYTDLFPIFTAIFVSISISVCSSVCTDMSRSVLIRAALLRHIFIHQLHIKRTWAVRLTMQLHMQQIWILSSWVTVHDTVRLSLRCNRISKIVLVTDNRIRFSLC